MTAAVLERLDYREAFQAAVESWHAKTGARFAAEPRHISPIPEGTDVSRAALGARMLGLELTPQGVLAAAVLEARGPDGRPLYDDVTEEVPRRSTKTTTVQEVLLGRCETIPGYRVIQSAQDGTRASAVFMDMVRTLELVTPDPEARSWTVFKSTGREYLQWANGSRWWVAPPKASSFRGLAADVLFLDECGEYSEDTSRELEAGALPVLDTRPDAQVIKAGTPGLIRRGMFWSSLEAARAAPHELGIIDYCALDSQVVDLDEDSAMALLHEVHPGLSCGLTTEAKMRKRFRQMDLATFVREYVCVWPPDTTKTALPMELFLAQRVDPVALPQGVPYGFGFNVAIGGVAAAVAAAWYAQDGALHVQVMEYRLRSDWLDEDLARCLRAHPGVPLCFDAIGDNVAHAQAVQRKPRTPTKGLRALTVKDVAAATATVAAAVDQGTFRWGASPALEKAAASSAWRESNGSRLFRRIEGQDNSALLAAVHAVAAIATLKKRASVGGYAPM